MDPAITDGQNNSRKRAPKAYIRDLERRVASVDQAGERHLVRQAGSDEILSPGAGFEPGIALHPQILLFSPDAEVDGDEDENDGEEGDTDEVLREVPRPGETSIRERSPRHQAPPSSHRSSPGPALMNPLAHGFPSYFADTSGRPIYLGTSSNWSFGRRVLAMAHEKVMHEPLSPDNLLFEGKSYDLGWDGTRRPSLASQAEVPALPSTDFATYLLSAVKFHCGQLFHLFEEEKFMQQFSAFQENPMQVTQNPSLWFIHYLLILAFGKAFVGQGSKGQKPPGAELFVYALTLMPEFAFYTADPIEAIQVVCCAALYLHCLDFRGAAFRMIGQALRMALENGMHTEMQSQQIDPVLAERSRKVWWTVYILDRQMSSLMGVPMGISDDLISAELPTFSGQQERSTAMKIQIQLSRVLAQILNTVYGPEGRLDKRFVIVTKEALKSVAKVTDQLNGSFGILENGSTTTISRSSAYLHLLYHQCIVLTTRPLLFTLLRSKLGQSNKNLAAMLKSGSVRMLLQMCVESAQQMLTILSTLLEHSLLESFLPFDLDAAFTSGIALLMATSVDRSFIKDPKLWLQRSHRACDEMISRGNMVAKQIKSELKQLEEILDRFSPNAEGPSTEVGRSSSIRTSDLQQERPLPPGKVLSNPATFPGPPALYIPPLDPVAEDFVMDDLNWQDGLSAEQLMTFAESMDLSALDWLSVGST
ncbi:hypothetical protein H2200_006404 [Cladophialophora chaetospira]|uniref:Xylanolytic transcriptional activator regulatory domain-containing protein n=1 Tax=Cladophialophora chaetospira TaxID=386627 RepID=A0AA38X848_9EURO|nr:hypothetical protein H2200_006404 [Cladophialophora chaetospira]